MKLPALQDITIATPVGPRVVRAYVTGQWSAHFDRRDGQWHISHVESGLDVPPSHVIGMPLAQLVAAASAIDALGLTIPRSAYPKLDTTGLWTTGTPLDAATVDAILSAIASVREHAKRSA